ncbi:hypothetical protein D3C87_1889590 [compost metagenome]
MDVLGVEDLARDPVDDDRRLGRDLGHAGRMGGACREGREQRDQQGGKTDLSNQGNEPPVRRGGTIVAGPGD